MIYMKKQFYLFTVCILFGINAVAQDIIVIGEIYMLNRSAKL